ncbi:ATPase [Shewanella oneidensis MR-1]|uniref:N-acetylglucosamine kinase NagK n=1 Tax=Shewanella oneidensis (strain ATCC 700550 / JCM 31522 / CIP 106686 / LMG 19005 / NCIMB 14063 / MR-1) TaxID=211586 RepID=Q8EBK6_SHEON|nr:BadF/BadG/BcrA/BcrD ATPase family protein [Shewanella oneidensis]AAN56498.1 N-acetylglucosamine kinase NagK [Shewanella oneidensis MR-1]MDX5999096.1 BadF/BadG/BcrA/BcrD ATPase family protein [Shewanella oneidensis]MEE2029577.1 Glucosamine kinase GspK [Shewanella oneidensis]QKG97882.1 ATPase [Shewanella oneidensis MR-1]
MGLVQTNDQQLFIGVDGGGSKCRATIYTADGTVLGTGVAGRANPLHGLAQTFESIEASAHQALLDAGMKATDSHLLVAGLGLAGVNVPRLYQDVVNWQHPFAAMYVTTDLHTACIGAHRGADGAVIITGTGSCGYAHVGDASLSIGGHGFALGDKGSGAWLGLKAAEHVLLALDGFATPTALTEMLLSHLGVKDALGIVEHLAGKSSSCYAQLARNVLDCANAGDQVAIAIVQEGADYISEMARKLFMLNPVRFSMIGGLAEPLQAWLGSDVVAKISETLAPPELGAMYYAQQQFNSATV